MCLDVVCEGKDGSRTRVSDMMRELRGEKIGRAYMRTENGKTMIENLISV